MENIKHIDLNNLSGKDMFFIKQAYQLDYNMYYNYYKNSNDFSINEELKQRKEDCLKKISDLGEKKLENVDKFIIALDDDKLTGFIKYHYQFDKYYVSQVDSIYGSTEEVIKNLIKSIENNQNVNLSYAMCNLNLNEILKSLAGVIKLDDFEKDANLLNKLTKEQLIEIVGSIKAKNEFVNSSNYMIDNSDENQMINSESTGSEKGFQKKITNGHSILNDETDRTKQGFVDALVLALLSGFVAGVITTLVIIVIKIKTGM